MVKLRRPSVTSSVYLSWGAISGTVAVALCSASLSNRCMLVSIDSSFIQEIILLENCNRTVTEAFNRVRVLLITRRTNGQNLTSLFQDTGLATKSEFKKNPPPRTDCTAISSSSDLPTKSRKDRRHKTKRSTSLEQVLLQNSKQVAHTQLYEQIAKHSPDHNPAKTGVLKQFPTRKKRSKVYFFFRVGLLKISKQVAHTQL